MTQEQLKQTYDWLEKFHDIEVGWVTETIVLQAYQPTTQKDRMLEEVAISQTETTKVKTVEIPAPREILKGDWGGK